jgi:hypothetical protein
MTTFADDACVTVPRLQVTTPEAGGPHEPWLGFAEPKMTCVDGVEGGKVSCAVTLSTETEPWFVTVRVYLRSAPTATGSGVSATVIPRSEAVGAAVAGGAVATRATTDPKAARTERLLDAGIDGVTYRTAGAL